MAEDGGDGGAVWSMATKLGLRREGPMGRGKRNGLGPRAAGTLGGGSDRPAAHTPSRSHCPPRYPSLATALAAQLPYLTGNHTRQLPTDSCSHLVTAARTVCVGERERIVPWTARFVQQTVWFGAQRLKFSGLWQN